MTLPQGLTLDAMANRWATILDPLLKNPVSNGIFLNNISILVGDNVINHLLQRKQQGYIIVDQTAMGSIYRSQPFNGLTLTLTSSTVMNVSLYVF